MTGYLLFIISILLCDRIKDKGRKVFAFFFIVTIFSGLRYGIGYDYYSYLDACMWGSSRYDVWEPIPRYFALFSQTTTPFLFFFLSSIFISLFYCLGINRAGKYYLEEVLFYISFPFLFMNQLGIIRQGMATAVVFYALTLDNSAILKRLVLIMIAYFCQVSSFVAILIIIPWNKISNSVLWIMLIGSLIVGSAITPFMADYINLDFLGDDVSQRASGYINTQSNSEGGLISYLVYFIAVIALINYKKLVELDCKNAYYVACVVFGTSLFAIFSFNISIAKRLCMFFFTPSILIIPQLTHLLKVPKVLSVTIYIILLSLTIYVGSGNHRYDDPPGYSVTYPYRTIFDAKTIINHD